MMPKGNIQHNFDVNDIQPGVHFMRGRLFTPDDPKNDYMVEVPAGIFAEMELIKIAIGEPKNEK
jgi:hypothetical protein